MEFLVAAGKFFVAYAPQLAGILLPPIVDWLNRDVHSSEEKFIVTLIVCGVTAVAFKWDALMMGSVDQIFASFTVVFIESQAVYNLYFKYSGLRNSLLERIQPVTETPAQPQ